MHKQFKGLNFMIVNFIGRLLTFYGGFYVVLLKFMGILWLLRKLQIEVSLRIFNEEIQHFH